MEPTNDQLTPEEHTERYTQGTWLRAEELFTGVPIEQPDPFPTEIPPHPNEIATRAAAEAGAYPAVVDDNGNEVDPLDVVGARSVAAGAAEDAGQ